MQDKNKKNRFFFSFLYVCMCIVVRVATRHMLGRDGGKKKKERERRKIEFSSHSNDTKLHNLSINVVLLL